MSNKIKLGGEMKVIPIGKKASKNTWEYQESTSGASQSYIITRNGEIAVRVYIDAFPSKEDAHDNMINVIDSLS